MQPASGRLATTSTSGARTSGPPRLSSRRRGSGRDRSDNLTLLKCDGRLPDDLLLPLQPRLDVERVAKVATDLDVLEVDGVLRPHDSHAAALRIENDRRRRNAPSRAGGCDLERDVDEHAGKQPTGRVWNIDLRQERPRARIE